MPSSNAVAPAGCGRERSVHLRQHLPSPGKLFIVHAFTFELHAGAWKNGSVQCGDLGSDLWANSV